MLHGFLAKSSHSQCLIYIVTHLIHPDREIDRYTYLSDLQTSFDVNVPLLRQLLHRSPSFLSFLSNQTRAHTAYRSLALSVVFDLRFDSSFI